MVAFGHDPRVYLGRLAGKAIFDSQMEKARESRKPEDFEEANRTRRVMSLFGILSVLLGLGRSR